MRYGIIFWALMVVHSCAPEALAVNMPQPHPNPPRPHTREHIVTPCVMEKWTNGNVKRYSGNCHLIRHPGQKDWYVRDHQGKDHKYAPGN